MQGPAMSRNEHANTLRASGPACSRGEHFGLTGEALAQHTIFRA